MSLKVTRRAFLEQATCAAALSALAGRGVKAAASKMWISLNGAVSPGVGGLDKIRLAAKVGYGGVDWDLGPAKTAGLDATKALFAQVNIKPTIVGLPMGRPFPFGGEDDAFKAALPQLADDAAFVAAVGCTHMMVVLSPSAPVPAAEYRPKVVDRISAVSEVLQKSNIRLGLEFLGPLYFRQRPNSYPFIYTLPDTVALGKDCGPNIGAVLDAWHWHHSGGTVADILATDPQRIVQVHVSDANKEAPEDVRDNQRLMPGEGIIDLVGFFQALQKIGYEGGVSPEPLGRIPKDMSAEDAAKLGLDTTTAVMKKAGVL